MALSVATHTITAPTHVATGNGTGRITVHNEDPCLIGGAATTATFPLPACVDGVHTIPLAPGDELWVDAESEADVHVLLSWDDGSGLEEPAEEE